MKNPPHYHRLLSFLLVILMVITSLSVPVTAQETDRAETETWTGIRTDALSETILFPESETETIPDDEWQEPEPWQITEITSRREQNVKHFDLGNGTCQAVVYPEAVHRLDAEGNWQDIDNRLERVSAGTYATADGRTTVAANAKAGDALITVSENGYVISMSPILAPDPGSTLSSVPGLTVGSTIDSTVGKISAAQIVNPPEKVQSASNSLEELAKVNNTAKITYPDVTANVSYEYLLRGNDVKENIIVSAPADSYSYAFRLALTGLYPELAENGEIIFCDSGTGETVYEMPAPYMYDADGEYSYDVRYRLTETDEKGIYTVTVDADENWLGQPDRAFPVTVDPSIQSRCTADTYIDSDYPTDNFNGATQIWVSSGSTPFFQMNTPTIPEGNSILSANLYVYCYYVSHVNSNELTIGAYQITSPWSPSTITWNSANKNANLGISTTQLSSCVLAGNSGAYESTPKLCTFNVTEAFKSWLSGSPNYGIALRYEGGTNISACIRSKESGTAYGAYYTVTYSQPIVPDGIYWIKNYLDPDKCLDVKDGGYTEGTALQLWHKYTSYANRNQLFKITYAGLQSERPFYTIRPMTNSAMVLYHDDTENDNKIVLKPAPFSSSQKIFSTNSYKYMWALTEDSGRYKIKNSETVPANYMTADSGLQNGASVFGSGPSSDYAWWTLEPYTDGAMEGINWRSLTTSLLTGETFRYQATMYSSESELYGSVRYEITDTSGGATDIATINATTGELTAIKPGQFRIYARSQGARYKYSRIVTIEESLEGTYFIQNVEFENYMQLDDGGGSVFELHGFDGDRDQKWKFIYVSNGYYKIQSLLTGKVATSPDDLDHAVWQDDYNGRDHQLWRIQAVGNGQYKFSPKNYPSYYMAAGDGVGSNGRNVEMRANRSDHKDEWRLLNLDTPSYCQVTLDYDNANSFNKTVSGYYEDNANSHGKTYTSISKSNFIAELKNTNCFGAMLHGGEFEDKLKISSSEILYLYELEQLPNSDFDSVNIVILTSCYSGRFGGFVDTLLSKGVDVVIGFEGQVEQQTGAYWTERFIYWLSKGYTVGDALNYADEDLHDKYDGTKYETQLDYVTRWRNVGSSDLQFRLFGKES